MTEKIISKKQVLINLFLFFITIIIFLFVFELGIRVWYEHKYFPNENQFWSANSLMHIKSNNTILTYELKPKGETYRDGVHIKINSEGFRDYDYDYYNKGKDVYRIIVLGDSVAFGWGTDFELSFTKVLESELTKKCKKKKIEVLNLAVDGYSTKQEVELLKTKGINYNPDLVIFAYVSNDPYDGSDGGLYRYFTQDKIKTFSFIKKRSYIFLNKIFGREKGEVNTKNNNIDSIYKISPYRQFKYVKEITKQENNVLIVLFPEFRGNNQTGENSTVKIDYNEIIDICSVRGFECIDLFEILNKYDSNKLSLDRIHPNKEGHRIVGEYLGDAIYPLFLENICVMK